MCVLKKIGFERQRDDPVQVSWCIGVMLSENLLDHVAQVPGCRGSPRKALPEREEGWTAPRPAGHEPRRSETGQVEDPEEALDQGPRLPARLSELLQPRSVRGFPGDLRQDMQSDEPAGWRVRFDVLREGVQHAPEERDDQVQLQILLVLQSDVSAVHHHRRTADVQINPRAGGEKVARVGWWGRYSCKESIDRNDSPNV